MCSSFDQYIFSTSVHWASPETVRSPPEEACLTLWKPLIFSLAALKSLDVWLKAVYIIKHKTRLACVPAWNRCPNLAQYWAILLVYCPEQHLSNLQHTHKTKNRHCSEVHLMFLYCTSSASALSFQHSLLVEKTTVLLMWLAAAALYFTVPMVWFLMEHHALNISLKNRNIKLRKVVCWKKIKTCARVKSSTHLQCVATHSLLQYSLSQSLLSMAGLLQPVLTHTLVIFSAPLDPFTSISSWKTEQRFGRASLL